MNFKYFASILALLVVILFQSVRSISLDSAKEGPCFVPKTTHLDLEWSGSVKKWYYPLQSRYDLYSVAIDLLGDPKKITEDQLYYESCLDWVENSDGGVTASGFGGRQISYAITNASEDFATIEFAKKDGSTYTAYTTLTDNESFAFSVGCFPGENQRSWGVASPYKTLPKDTIERIKKHAKILGFKEEFFTSQRYEICERNRKDEL